MVVWTLTGMWHGAAWNFVAWGVYYGVILVMEKYIWGASVDQLPNPVRHLYTGIVVLVGWVFFFSPSLGYAMRYLLAMIGGGAGIVDATGAFLLVYTLAAVSARSYRLIVFRAEHYKSRDTRAKESVCTAVGGSSHFHRHFSDFCGISCDRNV